MHATAAATAKHAPTRFLMSIVFQPERSRRFLRVPIARSDFDIQMNMTMHDAV